MQSVSSVMAEDNIQHKMVSQHIERMSVQPKPFPTAHLQIRKLKLEFKLWKPTHGWPIPANKKSRYLPITFVPICIRSTWFSNQKSDFKIRKSTQDWVYRACRLFITDLYLIIRSFDVTIHWVQDGSYYWSNFRISSVARDITKPRQSWSHVEHLLVI